MTSKRKGQAQLGEGGAAERALFLCRAVPLVLDFESRVRGRPGKSLDDAYKNLFGES